MQGGKYQTSPYQYHGNQHKNDGGGGHKFSPFGINIGIYLIYKVRLMGWLMGQGASSWLVMLAFDAT